MNEILEILIPLTVSSLIGVSTGYFFGWREAKKYYQEKEEDPTANTQTIEIEADDADEQMYEAMGKAIQKNAEGLANLKQLEDDENE